jgi:hypothetical protein
MVICDLLMETARAGAFRARWTAQIHDEWSRNLLNNRPDLDADRIRRRREAMDAAIHDAAITGYMDLIEGLTLPDPEDRHVLAAAIVGGADVIVTLNLKHFPAESLEPYGIEAQHPDTFLVHQRGLDEGRFLQCVRRCRRRMKNPEKTADEYLVGLRKAGLAMLAAELAEVEALI